MMAWLLNPYVQLGIGAILVTASELLLKAGATQTARAHGSVGLLGIAALASWWTWLGIVTYVLSFVSWIHVLRLLPLSVAFPLINVVHVLVPLAAWMFLGEAIPARRWAGIVLVVIGIAMIVRPVAAAEEKL